MTTRYALVRSDSSVSTVARYLPANYHAVQTNRGVEIIGHDNAGWTLEGYVIPRLASGLHTAVERIPNDVLDEVYAIRQGEDVFAVLDETTGDLLEEVDTTEQCDGCDSCRPVEFIPDEGLFECVDCNFQYPVFITIAERAVFQ